MNRADNGPDSFPQPLHRFPTPGNGGPSPPPGPLPSSQGQGGRIASNPTPRMNGSDFAPTGNMPKSQSMGFAPQGRTQDTHPYRGSLAGQPEEQDSPQTRLAKSTSMPFNKNTPPIPDQPAFPGSASPAARGSPLVPSTSNQVRPERERTFSAGSGRAIPTDQPRWMGEFAPIVELLAMQPQKTYVSSPPELEMIWARTSTGGQPKNGQPGSVTNDWDAVWLQLSGISMCEFKFCFWDRALGEADRLIKQCGQ